MATPVNPQVPWAVGQGSTTDQLAQQLQPGQSFTNDPSHNPLYHGAYNPMYNVSQGNAPTMKDLASLYYKSKGQGIIGDNPHPLHAANTYADLGFSNGPWAEDILGNTADALTAGGGNPVEPAHAVQKKLQAQIALAGGDRKAVFDQLTGNVQQRATSDDARKAGISKAEAQQLQGAGQSKGAPTNDAVMGQWMQDYISPYIQEQTAQLQFQANMFDQVVQAVIPTMSPQKAEIMQAYFPLLSQAYHQRADNFANQFLTGTGAGTLNANLLQNQKRNQAAINFLNGQGSSGSGGSSAVQNFINSIGK